MEKSSFVFHREWWEDLKGEPPAVWAEFCGIVNAYVFDGVPMETENGCLRFYLKAVKRTIDKDLEKYASVSEQRRISGRKGGLARQANPTAKDKETDEQQSEQEKETGHTTEETESQEVHENPYVGMDLSFVAPDFVPAFSRWIKYQEMKERPFLDQESLKASYDLLRQLSGGKASEAMRIVLYSKGQNYTGLVRPKDDSGGSKTNSKFAEGQKLITGQEEDILKKAMSRVR